MNLKKSEAKKKALALRSDGLTLIEIADVIGYSKSTIDRWLKETSQNTEIEISQMGNPLIEEKNSNFSTLNLSQNSHISKLSLKISNKLIQKKLKTMKNRNRKKSNNDAPKNVNIPNENQLQKQYNEIAEVLIECVDDETFWTLSEVKTMIQDIENFINNSELYANEFGLDSSEFEDVQIMDKVLDFFRDTLDNAVSRKFLLDFDNFPVTTGELEDWMEDVEDDNDD